MAGIKRVLVTSTSFAKLDPYPVEMLQENNWEVTRRQGPFSDRELAGMIRGFDAVIVGNDIVGADTVAAADRLKIILEHGTGIDNIDVDAAKKAGIRVFNVPHTNTTAVAEYAFAGLLSLLRKVPQAQASMRRGEWCGSRYVGIELRAKVLGVIGLGHIGRKSAMIGVGFGMDVLYHDIARNEEFERESGVRYAALDELLLSADFVILHIPLLDDTRHMIGSRELALMKPEAYLVNVARGGVVDEAALYEALRTEKLAGAVIDVFEAEPPEESMPVLMLENVICTPHLAAYTEDAMKLTSLTGARTLIRELS